MSEANEFMKRAAVEDVSPAEGVSTDKLSIARAYAMFLGGKDHFEIDRQLVAGMLQVFPEAADVARENRRFLYRAVRYLARDEGIDQFLDLGSGLPTLDNVHEVARQFQPAAKVVYVDHDSSVSTHGRALLAKDAITAFVEADITDFDTIRNAPETRKLLDFSRPVALLMFSMGHWLPDEVARQTVSGYMEPLPSGSFLALSHVVIEDQQARETANQMAAEAGQNMTARSSAGVMALLDGLEPVAPGLVDVTEWRPDPGQPTLLDPHPIAQPYLGASAKSKHGMEFGGVLRKL